MREAAASEQWSAIPATSSQVTRSVSCGGGDAPAKNNPVTDTKKYIDGVLHVWVPGFGYVPYSGDNVVTYAKDMYESGIKIGIMGGDECPSSAPSSTPAEQPEPTGDIIYAPIQPPVTKDSTPPAYKPNGEPYNQ